jgi:hypothetical protein
MEGRNGRAVPNQFEIDADNGDIYFQSYDSVIAVKRNGKIILDVTCWDYSKTTGRYRNQFLGETKKETERKIKDGTYSLEGLN